MKTLYLLRHAKSDWKDETLSDKERPLAKRGKRDAQLIAAELQRQQRQFATVYCSPAVRARETLSRFQAESNVFDQASVAFADDLYTFDAGDLLRWLRDLPQDKPNALIIGHNPALAEAADQLCDGKVGHVGTCTFLELQVNVEYWDQLRGDCAKLVEVLRPKHFR
ncbi:histidine phosphatase family protein [Spongiibacter taiwanensis]|uniref:SixA phosphatase family protein n=1 Tax=Spongiibacter taiwanensis TaxID=1748242 RepID=UPI002035C3E2|nr:histidine phosphatase family protein [Spongiibacter taiwanensis]USA44525.1 histidine phosphatase family protein [Spongiibacter taiwanensis]